MYNKKQEMDSLNTIPNWPDTCMVLDCSCETTVAFMRVYNKNNQRYEVGCAIGQDHPKRNTYGRYDWKIRNIVMFEQYDFKGWLTRCANHYLEDIERHGGKAIDNARKVNSENKPTTTK